MPRPIFESPPRLSVVLSDEAQKALDSFTWGQQKPFFNKLLLELSEIVKSEPQIINLYLADRVKITLVER